MPAPTPRTARTRGGDRRTPPLAHLGQLRQRVWYLWVPSLFVTILLAFGIAAFAYPGVEWPTFSPGPSLARVLPRLCFGFLTLVLLEAFYVIAKVHEIRELRAYILAISAEASFCEDEYSQDGLTGVFDRRVLPEILKRETTWVDRYRIPLCLTLLDIRHFGKVNEKEGNMAGDLILKELAQAIRATMRQTDSVLRYGADEFLCLLPRTDAAGGSAFARRVRQACQRSPRLRDLVLDSGLAVYQPRTDAIRTLAEAEGNLTTQKGAALRPTPIMEQAGDRQA